MCLLIIKTSAKLFKRYSVSRENVCFRLYQLIFLCLIYKFNRTKWIIELNMFFFECYWKVRTFHDIAAVCINKPRQREKALRKWAGVMWSLWEEYRKRFNSLPENLAVYEGLLTTSYQLKKRRWNFLCLFML